MKKVQRKLDQLLAIIAATLLLTISTTTKTTTCYAWTTTSIPTHHRTHNHQSTHQTQPFYQAMPPSSTSTTTTTTTLNYSLGYGGIVDASVDAFIMTKGIKDVMKHFHKLNSVISKGNMFIKNMFSTTTSNNNILGDDEEELPSPSPQLFNIEEEQVTGAPPSSPKREVKYKSWNSRWHEW